MKLIQGDCLEVLRTMDANSVDAIVTDPPAGISFMGKEWDKDKGGRQQWIAWMTDVARECLRVVKPGGHALVWAIPRTSHWTGMAWEDAGWEPRDKIYFCHGSGFPKSLSIGKAIDKMQGNEREVVGEKVRGDVQKAKETGATFAVADANKNNKAIFGYGIETLTKGTSEYEGYGTALKPAVEEWWLFRKPVEGTIAANVLKHGTGGLNIDGSRIGTAGETPSGSGNRKGQGNTYQLKNWVAPNGGNGGNVTSPHGRYPANLILSDDPEVLACFPDNDHRRPSDTCESTTTMWGKGGAAVKQRHNDAGSAARFFKRIAYFSKASKRDRDEGCEGLEEREAGKWNGGGIGERRKQAGQEKSRNHHPTVKSTELMRYLCKLITPENGIILDPFAGSGSTGKAAMMEGFQFIGIEKEAEYIEIAQKRIDAATQQLKLF